MCPPPHNPSFSIPGKVSGWGRGYHLLVTGMKDAELAELVQEISSVDLRSEAKKRGSQLA